jgi:cobalt-zinc-cadmium efflux system outer membrane protein
MKTSSATVVGQQHHPADRRPVTLPGPVWWISVFAGAGLLLSGCAHFKDSPLSVQQSDADFLARTLMDDGLKSYLESNGLPGEWPRPVWDFDSLTFAAFYYQPALDVARASWGVASAGETTAGERPNPTLSVSPSYNSTTSIPSPWIVTPSVDIPIETAGKRGYRIAQATHLSEAARLNIASVAWQVRSEVRRTLVDLDAARAVVTLLREQQAIQMENLRLLKLQFQSGAISAFELSQAGLTADSPRLAMHDAERQQAEAMVQLARAIGIPTAALDGVEFSFESLHALPKEIAPAEAQRQALFNRADIRSALAEYAATQSALQLEIAKQYPDIHLSPGYEFDQGDNKWSLGVSVTLPVLNHNQGAIAEAQARRTEAAAKFNALQAAAVADVDLALAGYRAALQKQAVAEAMLANLNKAETDARAQLEVGEISKVDLTALQIRFSADALARRDALTQAQQARGQLEDALQSPADLLASAELSPRRAPLKTVVADNDSVDLK